MQGCQSMPNWELVEAPKKKLKHFNMLTWPQNARNPISEDLDFKTFLEEDAPRPLEVLFSNRPDFQ